MAKWFGEPWPSRENPAPICSSAKGRIPTPTDVTCQKCKEPIAQGDRGLRLDGLSALDQYVYYHIECLWIDLGIERSSSLKRHYGMEGT